MKLNTRTLFSSFILCATFGLAQMTAQAGPVFQLLSGNLTVTAVVPPGGTPTYDIRGLAFLNVSDVGLSPSPLLLFDNTGGTDPSATVLPFGNSVLVANDSNTGTSGISAIVLFDFNNASFTPAFSLLVPATAAAFPSGSAPGPVLGELTGSQNTFTFALTNNVTSGDNLIFQWQLTTADTATPEPLSAPLMAGGIAVLCALQRYRSRARNI